MDQLESIASILDQEVLARAKARIALLPVASHALGVDFTDRRSSYSSWTYSWDDDARILKLTLFSQGGFMDSVRFKDKEVSLTEAALAEILYKLATAS